MKTVLMILALALCAGELAQAQRILEPAFSRRQIEADTMKVRYALQLVPGAQNGYYLKSDAAGRATWAAVVASTTWGSITGTLSAQSDLNSALNGKQPTIPNLGDTAKYIEISDSAALWASKPFIANQYVPKFSSVITNKPNVHLGADGNLYKSNDTTASAGANADTLMRKREMQYLKNAGAATGTAVGLAAAPTLSGVLLTADDANGPYLKHSTNTTANNVGGVTSAFTIVRRDWLPEMHTRVQMDTAANTDAVWWVGFFSAAPDSNGRPNTRVAAFRYHTKWDNTAFWRCVTIDGTGTTNETTVTSVATAINTPYSMSIYLQASAVRFFVNGALVATHSTVVPTATTLLGYVVRCANLSTVKHNIRWSRISIKHL